MKACRSPVADLLGTDHPVASGSVAATQARACAVPRKICRSGRWLGASKWTRARRATPTQEPAVSKLGCTPHFTWMYCWLLAQGGALHVMLNLDPVPEIPLVGAPLFQVICQVRFSNTPALVGDQNSVALADALAGYPVGRTVQGLTLSIGAGGDPTPVHQLIRQFSSTDGAWQVSVAEGFVSLETTAYDNRTDFCDRMVAILQAITVLATPPVLDRVGLRYIDRWSEPTVLGDITKLLEPPVRGIFGQIGQGLAVVHTIGQHMLNVDSGVRSSCEAGTCPRREAWIPPSHPWMFQAGCWTSTCSGSGARAPISRSSTSTKPFERSLSTHIPCSDGPPLTSSFAGTASLPGSRS